MITLGLVEDDKEIGKALKSYFLKQEGYDFEICFESMEKLLNYLAKHKPPQILIIDIGLPGMSGIEGIKLLKERYIALDIIVFSIYDDTPKIFDSLCAGATGYLLKSTPLPDIKEGIEILVSGGSPMSPQIARKVVDMFGKGFKQSKAESPLSPREKEIVVALVDGLSYKLIADRLSITIETVRFHIKNIYRKLQVHCKSEVITRSLRGEI